jgi:hypothetical protein
MNPASDRGWFFDTEHRPAAGSRVSAGDPNQCDNSWLDIAFSQPLPHRESLHLQVTSAVAWTVVM